jgi:hypothetical protein
VRDLQFRTLYASNTDMVALVRIDGLVYRARPSYHLVKHSEHNVYRADTVVRGGQYKIQACKTHMPSLKMVCEKRRRTRPRPGQGIKSGILLPLFEKATLLRRFFFGPV